MVSRIQTLRSSVKLQRPTGRQPGELFVNFADRQIGYVDAANAAQDLVAVRFFSASTDYVIGDFVINAGRGYRAKQAITAGAFNAANWDTVSTSVDLSLYAPLDSPALTGNPTAPTQTPGDNDTSIATTAFVSAAIAADITPWAEITGKPATFPPSTHSHPISDVTGLQTALDLKASISYVDGSLIPKADIAYVNSQDALKANIDSPVFTGNPTAPTPAQADNDTSLATTAFVKTAIAGSATATYIGDMAPGAPTAGQLWWDSDSGRLYIYYNDGNTSQWVEAVAAPVDLTGFTKETKGDWTPDLQFGAAKVGLTYSKQVGRWVKVGSTVTVWFEITLASKGTSTGGAAIAGMPYLPGAFIYAGTIGYATAFASTVEAFSCYCDGGGTAINLTHKAATGGVLAGMNDTAFTNTSRLIGSVSFEVAA